ncbi:hypothetical protein [Deinococcus petrolearius]|uniref:Uncharacterized protein n=1 Tax=Deinococcus petrolearius TaxID=1751295 RepID=A0ABW1DK70_9DEIO
MKALLPTMLLSAALLLGGAQAITLPAIPTAGPVSSVTRESTITLGLEVAASGTLLIAHTLPDGATFVPGSAAADGQPIDVRIGHSGQLYFTVNAGTRVVTYRVTHQDALPTLDEPGILRVTEQGQDLLQGDVDRDDARTAQRPKETAPGRTSGVLRLPLDGAVIQEHSTSVQVNYVGTEPELRVNGDVVAAALIGKRVQGQSFGELTYVAVPLRPGPNTIQAGGETITVQVPGVAVQVAFSLLQAGDARRPAVVRVQVQDAAGLPVRVPNVTLSIEGAQPLNPDAIPSTPGYQLALEEGGADLRLRPQAGGQVQLTARSYAGLGSFTLGGTAAPLIVGNASVTLGNLVTASGRATVEVPAFGGQLRAYADSAGLQPLEEVQTPRHLITGDASLLQNDLTARGSVAAEYRRPGFSARYALKAAAEPFGERQYNADGAAVKVQTGPVEVFGYHALTEAGSQKITADPLIGIVDLGAGLIPGSETVVLTGAVEGLSRTRTLTRGVDYTIVYDTGTLTLTRPVSFTDPELEAPQLTVTFSRPGDTAQRSAAWGVGARHTWGTSLNGGEIVAAYGQEAGRGAFGVKGTLTSPGRQFRVLGLVSGGVRAEVGLKQLLGQTGVLTVAATTQSEGYDGLLKGMPGTNVNAELVTPIAGAFGVKASAAYASVTGTLGAELLGTLTQPGWTAGLGIGATTSGQVFAVVEAGVNAPYAVKLRHAQGLTGQVSETTLSAALPVTRDLAVKVEDRVSWGSQGVQHAGAIGLAGRFGVSQYDVTYELPNAAGAAGRVRAGVQAEMPLGDHWSVGLRATTYVFPALTTQATVETRYRQDGLLATLGLDATVQEGLTAGVRGSLTYGQGPWTASLMGQSAFGVQAGHKYAAGLAYRGDTVAVLSTARYEVGALAQAGGLASLTTDATYHLQRIDLRAGLGLRTSANFQALTWQAYTGGTYWLTPRLGIGGLYRIIGQRPTGVVGSSTSLEVTVVPVAGLGVTAGYAFVPTTVILSEREAQRGGYVRLDVLFQN